MLMASVLGRMKREEVRAAESARKAARLYPGEQAPELRVERTQGQNCFDAHEAATRELLRERVYYQTNEAQATKAVAVHDCFVKGLLTCELGLGEEEQVQAARAYAQMLKMAYPRLTLDPHILSEQALSDYERPEEQDDLHCLRTLERRFIVYRSPPDDKAPGARSKWDQAVSSIWQDACERLEHSGNKLGDDEHRPMTYAEAKSSEDALQISCRLQDGKWEAGNVDKEAIQDEARPMEEVRASGTGTRTGRLYFTDGTIPNYAEVSKPLYTPGLACRVNDATNAVLPPPLRSSRGDSLLRFMRVESTGVASFTLFAPLGPGTGLTAFHQETKQRRSFNCGSGDFIAQPLATPDNIRRVEQLHTAVVGAHARHAQLLPLEMYLEAGIPMVLYVRDSPHAEMVELPEQSCHAFLSTRTAHNPTAPSLKVSCNDWCLRRELASAYLLERLVDACARAHVGHGHPEDQADMWTESSYFPLLPSRLSEKQAPGYVAPWMCPLDNLELDQDENVDARSHHMSVILVRTCEKLLDAAHGRQDADVVFAGETLGQAPALDALRDALPALHDLAARTLPDAEVYKQADRPDREWSKLDLNFTREYVEAVIQAVKRVLAQPPPLVSQPTFRDEDKQSLAEALKAHHDAHKRKRHESAAAGKRGKKAKKGTAGGADRQSVALAPLPNGLDPALFQQQASAALPSDGSAAQVPALQPLSLQGQGVWHDFWYQGDAADREKVAAEAEAVEEADLLQLSLPPLRQHWLLAVQRHVDAAEAAGRVRDRDRAADKRTAWQRLTFAYQRHCLLERCLDAACIQTVAANAQAWGCPADSC